MIVFRRRLLYWIIREYLRKWSKTIVASFAVGLVIFFILLVLLRYFTPKIPLGNNESIGVVGAYTIESLPLFILGDISKGLTTVSDDGKPGPSIAKEWKIEQNGKKYTFFLSDDIIFSDGTKFSSEDVVYNFSDADVKRPNRKTIVYNLKDTYSPFLISVSRPIFKKGLVGIGPYSVKDVKVNGSFVQTIILALQKNSYQTRTYQFYPSHDALKTAYILGEVSWAIGLLDPSYKKTSLENFPNTTVKKKINYQQLVTLFYNTQDSVLSDKRLRSALSYALPNVFSEGARAHSPIAPGSFAYAENFSFDQDVEQAKILLSASETATKSAHLSLEIKTLNKYKHTAEIIAKAWEMIDIKTKIVTVDKIPDKFQIFLGNFFLPQDPDQYTLWHSAQVNNITRYNNQRIDKLLEDGRKTVDINERKKIYSDFQKYLLADSPASFLFFPYEYEIMRK
ncbi:MAG: ABC transporter substrate-binding protein [Candidatus Levybacteria bacterium]|nr:ABC transporter substrate-binding protein [Candidatus Levybacteria bacterium]